MDILLIIIVMLALLLLKGFFSGSEIALVNADKLKLHHKSNQGNKGATMVLKLFKTPDEFKQSLQSCGLQQVEFARLTGTSVRTTNHWARHRCPNVVAALVDLLAERPELVDVLRKIHERREAKAGA